MDCSFDADRGALRWKINITQRKLFVCVCVRVRVRSFLSSTMLHSIAKFPIGNALRDDFVIRPNDVAASHHLIGFRTADQVSCYFLLWRGELGNSAKNAHTNTRAQQIRNKDDAGDRQAREWNCPLAANTHTHTKHIANTNTNSPYYATCYTYTYHLCTPIAFARCDADDSREQREQLLASARQLDQRTTFAAAVGVAVRIEVARISGSLPPNRLALPCHPAPFPNCRIVCVRVCGANTSPAEQSTFKHKADTLYNLKMCVHREYRHTCGSLART